jgi:signal transduction histidine kinase
LTIKTRTPDEGLEKTLQTVAERVALVIERFQQSKREVQRAGQLSVVGHLAAALAHELRNALMPAKLLVQSALHDNQPLGSEDLAVVAMEITRIETAVHRLLDFARPSVPEKSLFDLRTLVAESFPLIAGRTNAQGVEIVSDLPAQPVLVDADKEQLRQVLMNLLLNSLDAMPAGGELGVSIKSLSGMNRSARELHQGEPRTEGQVTLTVVDTGSGFPDDVVRHLFEPFVTTKQTGTGLGLSICKQNRPGRGAMLAVELPVSRT